MLKSPTTRRRSEPEQIELNLVPILDAMVTLISFLLFTMSFLSLSSIETPFPESSSAKNEQKLKEKPLQLTVSVRKNNAEIWSPFDRIAARTIPNREDGKPDTVAIHEELLKVKAKFPKENSVVIAPDAAVSYDVLIELMDSMRLVDATDSPIFHTNPDTGIDEPVKALFPNVVFGNLLGSN